MLIDTHAHLNFPAYDDDLEEVIKRCRDKGMKVVNVGSQAKTSQQAIKIAHKYEDFYASVGIHPAHLYGVIRDPLEEKIEQSAEEKNPEKMFEDICKLAGDEKVVAVGETGLDYFRIEGDVESIKKIQKDYFIRHLDLAVSKKLPVILHCRGSENDPFDAYRDALEVLKKHDLKLVCHCFGGDLEMANQFIDKGFYIGITGIVTFGKKAVQLEEVVKNISLDKILIETDCPYLAPAPNRGKRNEPVYVEFVAEKIAELRGVRIEEMVGRTGENARKLFNV